MKNSKLNKALSLILAVLMMFSSLPVTVFAAEENYGVMEVYTVSSSADYHRYFNKVYSVTFCDYIDKDAVAKGEALSPQTAWDVSVDKDRSVMAWMIVNDEATAAAGTERYDVYIGAEGGVKANSDSSWIFYGFSVIEKVSGCENFKTGNATTFYKMFSNCTSLKDVDLGEFDVSSVTTVAYMFAECKKLESVNLCGWNTSSLTNMTFMFYNCDKLTEVDMSSFDTSKVTTMDRMFYRNKGLTNIYVGTGWNTDLIDPYESVFNCCYALVGGEKAYNEDPTKERAMYAKVKPEGHLDLKYEVKYVLEGDIPENEKAPETIYYMHEEIVAVENAPEAVDGYTFSGWSTNDADISTGSFKLENDVVIVGTWEKIPEYTVAYVYDGDVPKNAPELPEVKIYYKGTDVTVADTPSYPGYNFSGWSTEDADISAGSFEIENNVVIVGKWEKIKAENLEVELEDPEKDWIDLKPGDTTKITVNVKPDGVIENGVTFESLNEDVVTVDKYGNVEAVGEGTTIIKITSKDNEEIFVEVSVKVEHTRYKVTYAYEGEVPEKAPAVPTEEKYIEGTTVRVEKVPTADGYVFSGWSTEDADVENNEFVINNDVHFVGSWEKCYNVYYKYDNRYAVPDGAPTADDLKMLWSSGVVAGEDVWVAGVMPTVKDHIFVGWYTEDVELTGDGFEMPEKDVTLYGYYKKPVESIEFVVNEDKIILDPDEVEEPKKLQVYIRPDDATIKDITFESSDESVVMVGIDGVLTPVGEGEATVTVKSVDDPSKGDTITVVVKKVVTDITVDKTEITLNKGDTDKVIGTVTPDDATNKEVEYKSGDDSIVTVDKDGNITAVNEGTTTITVSSKDDPEIKKEVTVTVKNPVTEITVKDKELEVVVEDTVKIEASANEDATEKTLIYESKTPEIAKVSADGTVLGLKEGTATITITSKDNPDVTKTVTVTVKAKQYKVTYEFVGEVQPENVTAPGEKFYKDGTTVDVETEASANGYIFSGWSTDAATVADGKFVINNDVHFVGSWTKLYNVTYIYEGEVPTNAPAVPAEENYAAGKTVEVKGVPSLDGYTFTGWYTEDVTFADGEFTMPAQNVVLKGKWEKNKVPVTDITVDKTEIELEPGKTDKIIVTVTPDDATDKTVTYTSSNPEVAEVEEDGTIVAKKDGETIITVKTEDGSEKTVTVKVTVKTPIKYYEVTYEYTGDVPAIAPKYETKSYEEGSEVKVEDAPSVDGYIFKGWTSKDADIASGKFDIYNDVTIVGKWEKINYYNVEYKYEGDVPAIAPAVPGTVTYEEGSEVTVAEVPLVDGYTFSGWSTTDADIASGKFNIYNDVTIVGKWVKINYYNVEYKYEGDVPENAPKYETKSYEEGSEVKVEDAPSVDGYTFSGWSTTDADITSGKFNIYNDVTIVGKWIKNKVPVTEITAEKEITIEEGKTDKIIVTVKPDNATDKSVTYESSNPDVVTVDENGNITAVKEGTAIIIVKSKDDHSKVTTVTVKVEKPDTSVTSVTVPKNFTMILGEETVLDAYVNANAANKGLIYESLNPEIATVDENGNIKTVAEGKATIRVKSAENPAIYGDVVITVTTNTGYNTKHYIVFGKTEKIGFYKVSLDGGETFFTQFGNDHLEVEKGTVIIVKAVDVFGDPFTFYINGEAVTPDENGYVHILVDKFILIGALGIPVVAPDAEESLNFFQQLIQKIKAFFEKLFGWLK